MAEYTSVRSQIPVIDFGRRVCVGRYFTLDTIFLYAFNVLTAFTMTKAVDDKGNIIEPTSEHFSCLF